jgi:hypothetical protein
MPLEAGQEQALEVFKASGEAVRFLMGERWQVTNYALAAYVALVATPELIYRYRKDRVCFLANLFCIALAIIIAVAASWHLCNLREQHAEHVETMYAAANDDLPRVLELLGWKKARPAGPGRVYSALVLALFVGAVLVALINLSRPMVVAWFNTRWVMAVFAGVVIVTWIALLVAWIAPLVAWRISVPFWRACLVQPMVGF